MRGILLLVAGLVAGLLSLSGCAKLNIEKTLEVQSLGDTVRWPIDGIKSGQKITVSLTVTGGPVDAYLFLEKDEKAAEEAIFAKKEDKSLILAGKRDVSGEAQLEATLPAAGPAVLFLSGKKATVKAKVTN